MARRSGNGLTDRFIVEAPLFLEALFAGKPDDLYVLLWTLPEKRSHWFRNVHDAIQFAESLARHDLYVGVGLSGQDYGPTRRCPSNEVAGIFGLWADLDLKSAAHPTAALPATVEEALKILPKELPPTLLILTGNGVHPWWLFREPLIFASDEERRDTGDLALRWQSLLRLNAASHGWAFDRLADLARVLRVPGTQNCKDPANPKPVEIHLQTDRRYNPSDLAEYLEDQGVPDAEAQKRAAQAWKKEFADTPLAVDPSATVPEDLLDRYVGTDPRFKKTWFRQREDLKDQSQSGYDLALANFGSDAGLSEQQVVDLIVQHRRIHSQRPRTRVDYFQRTIAKAFRKQELSDSTNSLLSSTQGADHSTSEPKADSATARALLCEQISNIIGFRVLRIIKIAGQEPTYRVEFETAKVVFPCIDKLVGQHAFRMKIASSVDHLAPRIPPRKWEQVAQMILGALTIEDGGDEADLMGAATIYAEQYLAATSFIDAEGEQNHQTKFKPTVYEGQIAIRSQDFQQQINKTWNESRTVSEVIAMLSILGAKSTRLKRTKLRDQTRWLLPLDKFPPDVYAECGGRKRDVQPS